MQVSQHKPQVCTSLGATKRCVVADAQSKVSKKADLKSPSPPFGYLYDVYRLVHYLDLISPKPTTLNNRLCQPLSLIGIYHKS